MDGTASATRLLLGGGLLGLVCGLLLERTHFCTMGSLADLFLFGGTRRLKAWLLAIGLALLGTQALAFMGLINLRTSPYTTPLLDWPGAILGGLMFGYGMVLAGGCASRALVRLGTGSLKALIVLLLMGVTAWATLLGVLAPLREVLLDPMRLQLTGQTLPVLAAPFLGGGLVVYSLFDRALLGSWEDLVAGLGLGLLVPAAWLVTAMPPALPAPLALTFVQPTAEGLIQLMATAGRPFSVALAGCTVLGAFISACLAGTLRLESFTGEADFGRHLAGGALMGVGGALAGGCTIGQGISGLSTLAVGSLLAVAGIVVGAKFAFDYLETGRILPLPREGA